jgi:NADH dehydrogenase
LAKDYPGLPMDKVRIVLYEHSPHLLAPFQPKLRDYAEKTLTERGIEVHTGTGVKEVTPTSITLASGEVVQTHTLIWAAGLQANPLAKSLGVELGPGGRIPIDATLQVQDHAGVFAIGDVAGMKDGKTGETLPGLGAVALQAGHYVGRAIPKLIAGDSLEPFHYTNKGTMAQIGRGAAVVELPSGGTLTGPIAWMTWLGVHLSLLNGAEEKMSVFVDWGWNAITHRRGKRIILTDEEIAGDRG